MLSNQGEVMMQFHIEKKDGFEVHVVPSLPDDEAKNTVIDFLKVYVKRYNVERYFMMHEGWIAQDLFGGRPSKQKNRKEGLIISEFKKNCDAKTIICLFHKEKDKIVFDEEHEQGESSTPFNVFLEDATGERVEQARLEEYRKLLKEKYKDTDAHYARIAKRATEEIGRTITGDEVKEQVEQLVRKGRITPTDEYKE